MEPDFNFTPPPLAPIFEPTEEEFGNFYEYLRDIYPTVVKTGVCKIRPPKGWKPPFCIDIDTFKFTPRIQRLNELEATSRVKLNFLDQLARFWELQGARLRVPCIDKRHVDLQRLSQAVQRLGGYDSVCSGKRWPLVAEMTGYPPTIKCAPAQLRQHYERIVRPFDIFKAGASTDVGLLRAKSIERQQASNVGNAGGGPPTRRYGARGGLVRQPSASSTGAPCNDDSASNDGIGIDYNRSKELRRLQYFGPGPKAAVPQAALPTDQQQQQPVVEPTRMEVKVKREGTAGWLDSLLCRVCGTSTQEELLLICESCQAPFHTFCLFPQLPDVPKGEWRCPGCVAKSFDRPAAEYGFEQSRKQYTLAEFGAMADQFKAGHFHKSLHCITYPEVEREFWRLLQALNEPVSVEYGADLHSSSAGSGFPTAGRRPRIFESREEAARWDAYLADEWNLNNLPLNEQGYLRFLQQDINGMVIPWCYVGMVFSAFCWHIEDHWSYSINYLHWGEPKTWYGVPASDAEALERAMRAEAGELFDASPDLLHHITTIMNPNQLMAAGVNVYRIDQEAGDFVITCPRAYHAGFNQGFNFAEAVNFCPSDWLPIGRQCIDNYASIGRHCVFSHEELVCAAAMSAVQKPACIKESQLPELLSELRIVAEREEQDLKSLDSLVINKVDGNGGGGGRFDPDNRSFERFEVLPDDDRQCAVCSTTLYVSAIVCQCLPRRLLCPSHSDKLCPKCTSRLLYRHTVPELKKLAASLSERTSALEEWRRESSALIARMRRARSVDQATSKSAESATPDCDRPSRERLVELCGRARRNLGIPRSCPLLAELRSALALADQAASIVQVLLKPPREENTGSKGAKAANSSKRVPYATFQAFRTKLAGLACTVDGQADFESMCTKIDDWLARCSRVLDKADSAAAVASGASSDADDAQTVDEAESLLTEAAQLPVSLDELPRLREIATRLAWRREVSSLVRCASRCSMARLEELNACQPPAAAVGQQLLSKFHALYDRTLQITYGVKILLQVTSTERGSEEFDCTEAQLMIEQARRLPVDIDLVDRLTSLTQSVDSWLQTLSGSTSGGCGSLAEAERLVQTGQALGVRLRLLVSLENQICLAQAWLRQAADAFLRPADAASAGDALEDIELALLSAVLPIGADPRNFANSSPEQAQILYESAASNELLQIAGISDADSSIVVERSKRPGMDTLLALLVANRGFQIRLPSGLAVSLLSERAIAWRQRVHNTLLSTVELRAALLLVARALHFRLPHRLMWQLRARLGDSADAELAGVSTRRPRKSLLFPRAPLESDNDPADELNSVDDSEDAVRRRRVDPAIAAARVSGLRLGTEALSRLNSLLAEGRLLEVGTEEIDWLRLMLRSASASATFAASHAAAAGGKRPRLLEG